VEAVGSRTKDIKLWGAGYQWLKLHTPAFPKRGRRRLFKEASRLSPRCKALRLVKFSGLLRMPPGIS